MRLILDKRNQFGVRQSVMSRLENDIFEPATGQEGLDTKTEWHFDEQFPRYYFILTNSRLSAGKVVKVHNGRGDVENPNQRGQEHTPLGQGKLPTLRGK